MVPEPPFWHAVPIDSGWVWEGNSPLGGGGGTGRLPLKLFSF